MSRWDHGFGGASTSALARCVRVVSSSCARGVLTRGVSLHWSWCFWVHLLYLSTHLMAQCSHYMQLWQGESLSNRGSDHGFVVAGFALGCQRVTLICSWCLGPALLSSNALDGQVLALRATVAKALALPCHYLNLVSSHSFYRSKCS